MSPRPAGEPDAEATRATTLSELRPVTRKAAELEFTRHAVHVMGQREIAAEWVERAVQEPKVRTIRTTRSWSGSSARSRNEPAAPCASS